MGGLLCFMCYLEFLRTAKCFYFLSLKPFLISLVQPVLWLCLVTFFFFTMSWNDLLSFSYFLTFLATGRNWISGNVTKKQTRRLTFPKPRSLTINRRGSKQPIQTAALLHLEWAAVLFRRCLIKKKTWVFWVPLFCLPVESVMYYFEITWLIWSCRTRECIETSMLYQLPPPKLLPHFYCLPRTLFVQKDAEKVVSTWDESTRG